MLLGMIESVSTSTGFLICNVVCASGDSAGRIRLPKASCAKVLDFGCLCLESQKYICAARMELPVFRAKYCASVMDDSEHAS